MRLLPLDRRDADMFSDSFFPALEKLLFCDLRTGFKVRRICKMERASTRSVNLYVNFFLAGLMRTYAALNMRR